MTILAGLVMIIVLAAAGYLAAYMIGFFFGSLAVVLWLCVRGEFDHG